MPGAHHLRQRRSPRPAGRGLALLGRGLALLGRGALGAVVAGAVALLLFLGVGPHLLGYRTLSMLSGSMRPGYPPGSELVDTRLPVTELRVGDIITYHIPVLDHHVESHRVTAIHRAPDGGWVVTTKGDANRADDPWTAEIHTTDVWTVRADVPRLGTLIGLARRPDVGRVVRWGLPAVSLLWLLVGVWRPTRDGRAGTADAPTA